MRFEYYRSRTSYPSGGLRITSVKKRGMWKNDTIYRVQYLCHSGEIVELTHMQVQEKIDKGRTTCRKCARREHIRGSAETREQNPGAKTHTRGVRLYIPDWPAPPLVLALPAGWIPR